MRNNKIRQIIYAILTIGLSCLLVYTLFFKPEPGLHVVIESNEVANLEPDNMVTARGLTIGIVKAMRLKNDFSGKIIIDILLTNEDVRIPKDSVLAVITDSDIMGTKQVQLVYEGSGCSNCLSDYDTIYSGLGSFFDKEIDELEPLMAVIQQTYETLDTAVKSWRENNLGDYNARIRQSERDIKKMMENFTEAGKTTSALLENTSAAYNNMSEDAAIIMASIEAETINSIKSNLKEFQESIQDVDFAKTQDNISATLEKWSITYTEIEQTQQLLKSIKEKLEKGQTGSLAQILNDPRFQSEESTGTISLDYSKLLKDIRDNPEKYTYLFYKEKE